MVEAVLVSAVSSRSEKVVGVIVVGGSSAVSEGVGSVSVGAVVSGRRSTETRGASSAETVLVSMTGVVGVVGESRRVSSRVVGSGKLSRSASVVSLW